MSFRIQFNAFTSTSNGQLVTQATVINTATNNVLWTEPITIDVTGGMTLAQVNQAVAARTSGFAARVAAIQSAAQFVGVVPTP